MFLTALPVFFACEKAQEQISVESISLNETSAEMVEGESLTLTAKITPSNATNKNISWKSDNARVATVDQNGKVTAVKAGKATITVISEDCGKSASCVVTVKAKVITVTSVTLNKSQASLKVGEYITLTATVTPDDATDKTVTWTTSDATVATVSNGVVTAKKVGTATITAKAGDKTATCQITILPTDVISVTLNISSETINIGETIELLATITPDNATDKSLLWSSSNPTIATISNGKVTAKAAGATTITAKSNNGLTASCNITVIEGSSAPGGSEGTGEEEW